MKTPALWLASACCALASATDDFVAAAREKHGSFGGKAARFLVEHMPDKDRESLGAAFLLENLDLALKARATFPWAGKVPENLFLNEVLPYAVFDEPRDPWRADFLEKATPIVKDARSASEAAQLLNKEFFDLVGTHYHTDRKRTNQSPKESIEQGKATCTGLSILLVDACRAVGVPARAVGTPIWTNGRGNHTWVEIWDGGWHFTGADEYDPAGLNRGWFTGDAAKVDAGHPQQAIYATSWERSDLSFPMVWSPHDSSVAAVDVTARYAKADAGGPAIGVRLKEDGEGDTRLVAKGWLTTASGRKLAGFETKAGTADLNDMPRVGVTPGTAYRLRFDIDGRPMETVSFTATEGEGTRDIVVSGLEPVPAPVVALADDPLANPPLAAADANRVIRLIHEQLLETNKAGRAAELENKAITLGDQTLRWLEKSFGEVPGDGRSLWISMHGGGGAPAQVNDQQWRNQIELYQPEEGICVAPRAPTDTWNLWHQAHIDPLFSRLIENMVALRGVSPDKVYLMGYSAGGDGVWQLAPRMADRFAAAAMMAGHPNEARLDGLRNLPFAIFMGAEDAAYERNKVAAERAERLAELHAADPGGYTHLARIYEGLPHWMNGRDAEAVPWMAKFTRRTWPGKLVWLQDDVTHDRFYWLQLPAEAEKKAGQRIVAGVDGQSIRLEGEVPKGTRLLLHDSLLNLDKPITVRVNDRFPRRFEVTRSAAVVRDALRHRLDPSAAPTASIVLK